jgi:hypothetical protein
MSEARFILMEAIARQKAVSARYNGEIVKLAPHLLFERHGNLFVSALNMTKVWRSDDERRLGQFNLAGLVEAQLLDEGFEALPSFRPETPRPDDTLILAI